MQQPSSSLCSVLGLGRGKKPAVSKAKRFPFTFFPDADGQSFTVGSYLIEKPQGFPKSTILLQFLSHLMTFCPTYFPCLPRNVLRYALCQLCPHMLCPGPSKWQKSAAAPFERNKLNFFCESPNLYPASAENLFM